MWRHPILLEDELRQRMAERLSEAERQALIAGATPGGTSLRERAATLLLRMTRLRANGVSASDFSTSPLVKPTNRACCER